MRPEEQPNRPAWPLIRSKLEPPEVPAGHIVRRYLLERLDEGAAAQLTLMLGAYLLVDGIFGAVLAFQVKPEKGWGWMLFSAVMSVILGFLLLREWPLTGIWAVGTLVGINMLFAGFAMISIGSAARKVVKKLD